jgi:hypothetical protein
VANRWDRCIRGFIPSDRDEVFEEEELGPTMEGDEGWIEGSYEELVRLEKEREAFFTEHYKRVLDRQREFACDPEPIYVAELQQADPALKDLWEDAHAYFRSQAIGFDPASPSAYERNLRHQVTHPPEWKRASWAEEDGEHYLRIAWDPTRRSGSFKIPLFHPRTNVEAREVMFQHDGLQRALSGLARYWTDPSSRKNEAYHSGPLPTRRTRTRLSV